MARNSAGLLNLGHLKIEYDHGTLLNSFKQRAHDASKINRRNVVLRQLELGEVVRLAGLEDTISAFFYAYRSQLEAGDADAVLLLGSFLLGQNGLSTFAVEGGGHSIEKPQALQAEPKAPPAPPVPTRTPVSAPMPIPEPLASPEASDTEKPAETIDPRPAQVPMGAGFGGLMRIGKNKPDSGKLK